MTDHLPGAGKMMPKALELADVLDFEFRGDREAHQAAAELRRLHEENEAFQADSDILRKIGALCRNQTRFTGRYDEIVKCSLAENEQLQKALRYVVRTYMVADDAWDAEAETEKRIKYVMERIK